MNNLRIFFFILVLYNVYCDPSLGPSRRDGSDEGSQHMFSSRTKKEIIRIILNTPLIWDSALWYINIPDLKELSSAKRQKFASVDSKIFQAEVPL